MSIALFVSLIALHSFGSLFLHSFYLHRYVTHEQFSMNRFWERTFCLLTWLLQGPAFLNPKSYAMMHLEHHAHSDTELDPHSPLNFSKSRFGFDFAVAAPKMMLLTKKIYFEIKGGTHAIAKLYRQKKFPEWQEFESFASSGASVLLTGTVFVLFYLLFAPVWWCWLFLPVTLLNGPIQGGIVNWCGHMWGYRNHELQDNSKNTWLLSTLMLGELFQNNHHHDPKDPNFGDKWFELDPTYWAVLIFDKLRIIRLK